MAFVVLSLGGSMVNPGVPDVEYLNKLAALLQRSRHKFGIVVGGGSPARQYAEAVRKIGGSEFQADEAAIMSTKQNAKLVISALGSMAYQKVADDFDEAKLASAGNKIVVMGGTIPEITTDTDSVLLAECLGAVRVVNISNVDAVYTEDPRKSTHAKKFAKMTFGQLLDLAEKSDTRKAGTHFIFDLFACKLIARSEMETHFVAGKNMKDVGAAIEGKKHSGTVVK